jgi:hypothetical protein
MDRDKRNALLKRWSDFARFAEDGRICLIKNAAERAQRDLALGRKKWLFVTVRLP